MTRTRPETLIAELLDILGEPAFAAFTQTFGGCRLNVPRTIPNDHDIARAIGAEAAERISRRFSPAVIRVPMARKIRARYYRSIGYTNRKIAVALGITETGVDKLFERMDNAPAKGSAQLSLFD